MEYVWYVMTVSCEAQVEPLASIAPSVLGALDKLVVRVQHLVFLTALTSVALFMQARLF